MSNFDSAAAAAAAVGHGNSITWTHNVGPDATVLIVDMLVWVSGTSPAVVPYLGGNPLPPLSAALPNYYAYGGYYLSLFKQWIFDPPTGQQTLAVFNTQGSLTQYMAVSSVSYNSIAAIGAPTFGGAAGSAVSRTIPAATGQIIAQSLGGFYSNGAGGFTRYSQNVRESIPGLTGSNYPLLTGDAPGAPSVSFTGTAPGSGTVAWGSIEVPLIPVGPSPFLPLLAKLANNQPVTIQVIGDSTAEGYGDTVDAWNVYSQLRQQWFSVGIGWSGRIAAALGAYYDVNAYLTPWDVSGLETYDSTLTLHTGSRSASVTVMNGAAGGEGLGYFDNLTRLPKMLTSGADVIILSDGFNDHSLTPAQFTAAYLTWIGHIQAICPGVPIIAITQNPSTTAPYAASQAALMPALISALASQPGVTVLDTRQAFTSLAAQLFSDGIHPSPAGYTAQANWMLDKLAPPPQYA